MRRFDTTASLQASRFTHVVTQNPNITSWVDDQGIRSVTTTADVRSGDVLLLEHSLVGTVDQLRAAVRTDPRLFNHLSPAGEAGERAVRDKVNQNAYRGMEGRATLSLFNSSFRTALAFNCIEVTGIFTDPATGGHISLVCVWASQDISSGTELCLWDKRAADPDAIRHSFEWGAQIKHHPSLAVYKNTQEARNTWVEQFALLQLPVDIDAYLST
jgi:hypothetical protein